MLSVDYGGDFSLANTDVIPAGSQTLGSGVDIVVVDGSPSDTVSSTFHRASHRPANCSPDSVRRRTSETIHHVGRDKPARASQSVPTSSMGLEFFASYLVRKGEIELLHLLKHVRMHG